MHPSTFETLALDADLKRQVMGRLSAFKASREYYARTGRAQKMGFLLYGPPGTGKSSFIAAVANFMHYDVFDLDLSAVEDNSCLRSLLTQMSDKAVVVVEDIDTADLPDRRETGTPSGKDKLKARKRGADQPDSDKSGPTLGGMLNFTDGLQSSSGSERIFIFTSNCPDRLDPALIRPGRCDMHVCLSFCDLGVFKHLLQSYMRCTDHELLEPISRLLHVDQAEITPAQAAGYLDAHKGDVTAALAAVCSHLEASSRGQHSDRAASLLVDAQA